MVVDFTQRDSQASPSREITMEQCRVAAGLPLSLFLLVFILLLAVESVLGYLLWTLPSARVIVEPILLPNYCGVKSSINRLELGQELHDNLDEFRLILDSLALGSNPFPGVYLRMPWNGERENHIVGIYPENPDAAGRYNDARFDRERGMDVVVSVDTLRRAAARVKLHEWVPTTLAIGALVLMHVYILHFSTTRYLHMRIRFYR